MQASPDQGNNGESRNVFRNCGEVKAIQRKMNTREQLGILGEVKLWSCVFQQHWIVYASRPVSFGQILRLAAAFGARNDFATLQSSIQVETCVCSDLTWQTVYSNLRIFE